MEKYYFEKELKEAVLIRNGGRPTAMVLNGEEVEVCCPELCSMNIGEDGNPCLVSEDKISSDKKYEVVAFSLDYPNRENKDWICLEPAIFEDALEFFLFSHCMEGMVNGCTFQKMESRGIQDQIFLQMVPVFKLMSQMLSLIQWMVNGLR